jgi:hypothetical protein
MGEFLVCLWDAFCWVVKMTVNAVVLVFFGAVLQGSLML